MKQTLTVGDFADLFDCTFSVLDHVCNDLINSCDFHYEPVSPEERDQIILQVLQVLEQEELQVAGKRRLAAWETGWAENETAFIDNGFDKNRLIPRYFRAGRPIRLRGEYVQPRDSHFEVNFIRVLRRYLASKYLADVSKIYEFGCGTGYHLIDLAEQFPALTIYGLDWTRAAARIIDLINQGLGLHLQTGYFDFFSPPSDLRLGAGSGVITLAALEQVGQWHEPFVDYLLEQKPKVCIHLECVAEVYDTTRLTDFLALCYHRKRGYLDGFLTRLRTLEQKDFLTIDKVQRTWVGDTFHEAYTVIVWHPNA